MLRCVTIPQSGSAGLSVILRTLPPVALNTSPESPYASNDAFEHLRLSLFARQDDVFCMLTAYFDDSGTSATDPVAVVAGYLATANMWEMFTGRWNALLGQYGIKQLRRTDLENFKGEFEGWNPSRRTEFVKKAHAIIRRCTCVGFGLGIIKSDFEKVIPETHPFRSYGLYGWCAQGCLAGVKTWCDAKNLNEPIQYVFEAGTPGDDQFSQMLGILYRDPVRRKEDRIGGWSFQSKDILPLQAADLVAYEFYKFLHNEIIDQGKRAIRLSARDLFRSHEIEFFRHFDNETFQAFVEGWKTREPPEHARESPKS